jgi:hypothetical protein
MTSISHHPGGGRTQDDRTQHRRLQVAHDLLEREQNTGDGRVEGSGDGRGCAHRKQRFYLLGTEAETPAEHGCDAGPDLDGRTFAAQRDAAGQGRRTAEEFSQHGAQQDAAFTRI